MKLSYTPNELNFGTSGLRGLVTDMTDLECYINTAGFIDFLVEHEGKKPSIIYLAGDLRSSTLRILEAVAQAITDKGVAYEYCGLIPTPAVAYYAQEKSAPCIMVTGSHIPDDRNGIKFYKTAGEVLKDDEASIKDAVAAARAQLYADESGVFDHTGMLTSSHELSSVKTDAEDMYRARFLDVFPADSLGGETIVMYQHSAVGRDLIKSILESLGATVVAEGRSDDFIPIDTENVTPDDAKYFKQLADENPGCLAIISTDGDSDRPFVIDEQGEFQRGDILGVVVSEYLGVDHAAFPISVNDAVNKQLTDQGIPFKTTKIGSPHVIVAMQAMSGQVGGWEVNGGYLLGSDVEVKDKTLKALPTRDALLPIVCALLQAKAKKQAVSELFDALPQRFTQAGMIDNFPSEVSAKIVETLKKSDAEANRLISAVFKEADFGAVSSIDSTDGIRITFSSGDIAHIRPSGNAPQLRIYTNADSQKRADEIVALGIGEPSGLLRQLEQAV